MFHHRARATCVFFLVAVGAESGGSAQPAGAAARIRAEVRAAWNAYFDAFSRGQTDVIADRMYLAPSLSLADATGVVVSTTAADVKDRFDSSLAALAAQQYGRSVSKRVNICVLNEVSAVLSGEFTRYRRDGTVLAELAGTYLFVKAPAGWRIGAQIAHEADRVLSCGT
ncbi:MAG: DUF4440 domain-containing protein [Vicinamibacterales bacterium]